MFEYFMDGYWNQMAPDMYEDFHDALKDFRENEGNDRFLLLSKEIRDLHCKNRFPSIKNIKDAYSDKFWSSFGMIITREDIDSCLDMLRINKNSLQ